MLNQNEPIAVVTKVEIPQESGQTIRNSDIGILFEQAEIRAYDGEIGETKKISRNLRRFQILSMAPLPVLFMIFTFVPESVKYYVGIATAPFIGVFVFMSLYYTWKIRERIKMLSKHGDSRLIGPCLEMMQINQQKYDLKIVSTLNALLLKVKESDGNILSNDQRKILKGILAPNLIIGSQSEDSALQVAVLKAYEHIGGQTELTIVSSIAHSEIYDYPSSVVSAAKACLPYVQKRAATENESSTLLRASSPPDTPNEELLRPAQDSGRMKPEELLRAHDIPSETHFSEEDAK